MPEKPLDEEALFHAARQIADPDARGLFIDKTCGVDAALAGRVRALLEMHAQESDSLEPPSDATGAYATVTPVKLAPGSLFAGRYKLRQQLGEGGMGVVYVADQTEPVQRRVALKIIRANLPTQTLLARFEQERQALALMDHPNIAKVYDAGVADGTPYFVMELIKGLPITKYCDDAKLTPWQRLELFIPVCQAVQHAHQKGIIHRDLKPSNIIVGLYDGRPVPKVIDFGVAKMSGPKLTEHSVYTEAGTVIGTLEYMSPEQAELNNLDIDTRTDIYALGVILYELLTGTVPFSRKDLEKAGFAAMLRAIKEQEPSKPSTKLSGSGSLPSVAACRQTEPAKLTRLVRGDLDWITMKALEKDRTRRYETANGFAMDVQRYLAGEAVQAAPPSASYRLRKFVRRNMGQVIAASLVFFALLAGLAGTKWQAIQTNRARVAEIEQRKIAEANDARADAEKKRAVEFSEKALDALRATTGTDVELLIGGKTELAANEKAYLEAIAKRWQAFAKQEGTDEQSRDFRAEGHFRVAYLWAKLGRRQEARPEYEQALAIREKLAADFPAVSRYRSDLVRSHNNLANLLAGLGKRTEAEKQYKKALMIEENLAADFPAVPDYRMLLAGSHNNLGLLLADLGKRAEAQEQYTKAIVIREKLAADFPAVPNYSGELARSHNNLGLLLADLGKRAEAEEQYNKALVIHEKLAAEFPTVPDYRSGLAQSHNNLGNLLANLGKEVEAEEQYTKALMIHEKLAADFPAVPTYRSDLAMSHNNLGLLLADLGKRAEAEKQYNKALAIQERLAADFLAVPGYRIDLGGSYCNFGVVLARDVARTGESVSWFDKAIATLTPVHRAEPRDVRAKHFLRNSHFSRARAYDQLQKYANAVKDWDRAVELSPPAEQARPRASRATSRLQAGQVAEAVAEVIELTKSPRWNAGQWYDFACVYAVASGKIADKKQEYADRAMELLQKAVNAGYKDAAHMKKDTDLDPLREREDFKKLIAELEKKTPLKKKSLARE